MEEEEGIILPLEKSAPTHRNPKNLIIFSRPKTGKSSLLAGLEDSLLIDLEDGSDYISARKLKAKSIKEIKAIGAAIKEAGYPYKYIGIDTITSLAPICIEYAEIIYSKLPMGKYWFEGRRTNDGQEQSYKEQYGNLLNLPKGAGYVYYWDAYEKIIDYVQTLAPNIIQLAHVKDSEIGKEDNKFTSLDLALQGKLKMIATSKSDAIGYLYRKGNKNIISFKTSDEVACGARPEHLGGQEIILSEMIDGKLITHWDKIYLEEV